MLQIFDEFLVFWDLFYKPLGETNNRKLWETSKIFVNIGQGYCAVITLRFYKHNVYKHIKAEIH